MTRSLNELIALATKAARGAGLPMGHAEDYGLAIAATSLNEDAAKEFLAVLAGQHHVSVDDGPPLAIHGSPVMSLPMAIDALLEGHSEVVVQTDVSPALLKGYLARAAIEYGISIEMRDGRLRPANQQMHHAVPSRVDLANDIWAGFEELAARTYVPATEASRQAGAGAGLSDND